MYSKIFLFVECLSIHISVEQFVKVYRTTLIGVTYRKHWSSSPGVIEKDTNACNSATSGTFIFTLVQV